MLVGLLSGGGEASQGTLSMEIGATPGPESPTPTPSLSPTPTPEPLVTPTPTPVPEPPAPPLTSTDKIAYLTFDDGPSQHTPGFLELLRQHGVVATFFVIGRGDEVYRDIVAGGHAIGLHGNSHQYADIYRSDAAFYADLGAISGRVAAQVGYEPKIMRFPGGSSNTVSRRYNRGIMGRLVNGVHERGYRYYDWNGDTGDGMNGVTVASEIAKVAGCTGDTLYLLAHDTSGVTLEAMRTIIPDLLGRGYRFLPITMETPEYHHGVSN